MSQQRAISGFEIRKLNSYKEVFDLDVDFYYRWPFFSLLDKDFLNQLKLVYVFGGTGSEVLMITTDDQVYVIGTDAASCLGIGGSNGSLELKKNEDLCNLGIVNIASGSGPHVLAVTAGGELYAWGHNGYCQLGSGNVNNHQATPTQINTGFFHTKIKTVVCGCHHTLALTVDGEVYGWGQNSYGQVGNGATANQSQPRRINGNNFAQKLISQVACGQNFSIALTEAGEVYGWGYNGNGQLGLGNNTSNQNTPVKVMALSEVFITAVTCGYAHVLALSEQGLAYGWGANSYGQLGTGNKAGQGAPIPITINSTDRIVELAATHHSHTSAALTAGEKVYMWGQLKGQGMTSPMLTHFHNLFDVFACFSTPSVTYKPLNISVKESKTITESLQMSFDDQSLSDIAFVIEGRKIYVHKCILSIRSDYFRKMFDKEWTENTKDEIVVTDFSYNVFRAFLQYLYTDTADLPSEEAVGLLNLANFYCEPQLKRLSEKLIRQGITVDNVCFLYAAAIKFDAKELQDFCFRFAVSHLTSVVQTEAFEQLEPDTMKDLIQRAGLEGAFRF